eukprot:jgi/Mesen1/4434/ME000225S03422
MQSAHSLLLLIRPSLAASRAPMLASCASLKAFLRPPTFGRIEESAHIPSSKLARRIPLSQQALSFSISVSSRAPLLRQSRYQARRPCYACHLSADGKVLGQELHRLQQRQVSAPPLKRALLTSSHAVATGAAAGAAPAEAAPHIPDVKDASAAVAKGVGEEEAGIPPYVPLHVHSDFSFLDGASQLPGLVQEAKALGMPALALTDHGVMYGAVELVRLCKAAGIKPIIGNEMYIVHEDPSVKHATRLKRYHLTVLAKNRTGYRNLVHLTTFSHLQGTQLLEAHREGLIICSGCMSSEVCVALRERADALARMAALSEGELASQAELQQEADRWREEATNTASWYKRVFGDDYYLEVMNHKRSVNRSLNQDIMRISRELDIKVVATNDSHFTKECDYKAHTALIAIKTGKKLDEPQSLHYCGEEYLKSAAQMWPLLEQHMDKGAARQTLVNTAEVADKVEDYSLFIDPKLPDYQVPAGKTEDSLLAEMVWAGMSKKLGCRGRDDMPQEYRERLDKELGVIAKQGFSAYFLVVGDIIGYARRSNIPVGPGRGSAAGSLAAYALDIIGIDPVKYGLLFERFLNEERRSLPDIDSDFCWQNRDKILEYIKERFGAERVAQIVTFNRLQSRAVLRDVGRVMGQSFQQTTMLTKMVPIVRGKSAKLEALIGPDTPSKEFLKLYETRPDVKEWVDMARTLEGTHKTYGVHAAGVVISPATYPLREVVPLQRGLGKASAVVTQYAMDDIEALGLLKFDILGLRNLTCIAHAYTLVSSAYGVALPPMEALPTDDARTFALLSEGHLEASAGMKKVVTDMAPSRLEDIFAIVALYRPGPLDAGLVEKFINRKHKREEIKFETPQLEPILAETYGVLVYQEQIMQMARDLAGYSLGQADLLRRAMGKKKPEEMRAHQDKFVSGAVERGVDARVAQSLFDQMLKFAEYCFNKSHSAAYGYISYVTAYLKANFPVAYMTAVLSSAIGDMDHIARYSSAAEAMGIRILPPDINRSGASFTVASVTALQAPGGAAAAVQSEVGVGAGGNGSMSGSMGAAGGLPGGGAARGGRGQVAAAAGGSVGTILYGLEAVRHVGEAAVAGLLEERQRNGEFTSIPDVVVRINMKQVPKKALMSLAEVGALDCLYRGGGLPPEGDVSPLHPHQQQQGWEQQAWEGRGGAAGTSVGADAGGDASPRFGGEEAAPPFVLGHVRAVVIEELAEAWEWGKKRAAKKRAPPKKPRVTKASKVAAEAAAAAAAAAGAVPGGKGEEPGGVPGEGGQPAKKKTRGKKKGGTLEAASSSSGASPAAAGMVDGVAEIKEILTPGEDFTSPSSSAGSQDSVTIGEWGGNDLTGASTQLRGGGGGGTPAPAAADCHPASSTPPPLPGTEEAGGSDAADVLSLAERQVAAEALQDREDAQAFEAQLAERRRRSRLGEGAEGGEGAVQALTPEDIMRKEKALLGNYLTGHPLHDVAHPRWFAPVPLAEVPEARDGSRVRVVALLATLTKKTTRNGAAMATVVLEDRTGRLEGVAFPDVFERAGGSLSEGAELLLWGHIDKKEGSPSAVVGGGEGVGAVPEEEGGGAERPPPSSSAQIKLAGVVPLQDAKYLKVSLTMEEAQGPAKMQELNFHLGAGPYEERAAGGTRSGGGGGPYRKGGLRRGANASPGVPVVIEISDYYSGAHALAQEEEEEARGDAAAAGDAGVSNGSFAGAPTSLEVEGRHPAGSRAGPSDEGRAYQDGRDRRYWSAENGTPYVHQGESCEGSERSAQSYEEGKGVALADRGGLAMPHLDYVPGGRSVGELPAHGTEQGGGDHGEGRWRHHDDFRRPVGSGGERHGHPAPIIHLEGCHVMNAETMAAHLRRHNFIATAEPLFPTKCKKKEILEFDEAIVAF